MKDIIRQWDNAAERYAGELLAECEKWAAEKGRREFASDCELFNRESRDFHQAMHFSEANRIICFIKKL